MDEVLEKLVCSIIGSDAESYCGGNSFSGYYKNWGKFSNQDQRRKEILNVQKNNRNNKVDTFRGILDIINEEENNYDDDDEQDFQYHKNSYRPSIYVAGFTKASPTYKNVLMLSEWMVEKPEDFHENWTVTPCPKGVRSLVVASNGTTKCYSKYGNFRFQCSTALPGGNRGRNNNQCCILDCFYVELLKTMFILDLLAWNSQPMTDGESEFRYFWLQSQLDEIPEISILSKTNKLIFKVLPKVSCDKDSFQEFMMKAPHFPNYNPGLDGLLFYHKKAQYVSGQTPLVSWLFPYMVPEVFENVKINQVYMLEVPMDYKGQAEYISRFEENVAKKKARVKRANDDAMDTTAETEKKNKHLKKPKDAYMKSVETNTNEPFSTWKNEKPKKIKEMELIPFKSNTKESSSIWKNENLKEIKEMEIIPFETNTEESSNIWKTENDKKLKDMDVKPEETMTMDLSYIWKNDMESDAGW